MLQIALYEPQIPPNTGNIIRLCANTGAQLHLIKPLGFKLDDKKLRRAGLDYHEWAKVQIHANFTEFLHITPLEKIYACSTKGLQTYTQTHFQDGDILLFGPETHGLPHEILGLFATDRVLRIPMQSGSRSINLSNAVAIVLYEAWRQLGFI